MEGSSFPSKVRSEDAPSLEAPIPMVQIENCSGNHSNAKERLLHRKQGGSTEDPTVLGAGKQRRTFMVDNVPEFVFNSFENESSKNFLPSSAVASPTLCTRASTLNIASKNSLQANAKQHPNSVLFLAPQPLDYEISAYGSYREALAQEINSRTLLRKSHHFGWQEDITLAYDVNMGLNPDVLPAPATSHQQSKISLLHRLLHWRANSMFFLA
eukprot:Sdes_comp9218_c0_seq1m703